MTHYGSEELARSFRTVRRNTIQVADDIPEAEYAFQAAPEGRSVEKLLTHIALGYRFHHQIHAVERLSTVEGFDFFALFGALQAEEAEARTKAEVIELLEREGEIWATFLDGVSDDFLSEIVTLSPGATPPEKSRLEILLSVKEHEMHHRGQLMLIERLLGVVPHLTRQMEERMAQMQEASTE